VIANVMVPTEGAVSQGRPVRKRKAPADKQHKPTAAPKKKGTSGKLGSTQLGKGCADDADCAEEEDDQDNAESDADLEEDTPRPLKEDMAKYACRSLHGPYWCYCMLDNIACTSFHRWAGLSEQARATLKANTRKLYAAQLKKWIAWCMLHNHEDTEVTTDSGAAYWMWVAREVAAGRCRGRGSKKQPEGPAMVRQFTGKLLSVHACSAIHYTRTQLWLSVVKDMRSLLLTCMYL
jgi:hypothetical protein